MAASDFAAVSRSLAEAQRETRQDVIGSLLDAIGDALGAGEFVVIEVGGEPVNENIIADVMVALQNARDAAERIR